MTRLPPFNPGPIVGIEIYARDVVVRRRGRAHPGNPVAPERGTIVELSRKSRSRLAFIANNTPVEFVTMVTLTYPRAWPSDGKTVKRNLRAFLSWCRRRWEKVSYLWFLEFQRRGAPHVHLFLDAAVPQAAAQKKVLFGAVSRSWYRIVGSDDLRHLGAGTRVERIREPDGARRYALKDAYKTRQKRVPVEYQNVGRFWGCSRNVPPAPAEIVPIDESTVRMLLDGWQYAPADGRMVYRVLYGCAERFAQSHAVTVWRDLC